MAVDGLSGFVVGRLYDRRGPLVLLAVPVAAAVAAISFGGSVALVWAGAAVWGIVNGVLDSTVKAVVTELVPSHSRAVAFGWLAFVRGVGLLAAGGILGAAYAASPAAAVTVILAANALGFVGLALVLRRLRHS